MERAHWQTDGRSGALAAAALWLVVCLMVFPEALDYSQLTPASIGGPAPLPNDNSLSHFLWMLALATTGGLTLWRLALAQRVLVRVNPWFWLLLLLATLSLGWSIDPALTSRRLVRVATLACTLCALHCHGWHERRLQGILRPLVTSLLLGSLVFGWGWPEYAIHRELSPELLGAWRGLTSHKNALGGLAATGCVLWTHAGISRDTPWKTSLAGFAVAIACLLLSRSTTSLLAALFACGFLAVFLRKTGEARRRLSWVTLPVLVGSLLLGMASVSSLPGLGLVSAPVALLAGKDGTLTGRTAIWELVREHISQRPLFGSGYSAYWEPNRGRGSESAIFVKKLEGFYPGSSHNGYLEVTNDLGTLGLLALVGYLVTHVRTSLKRSATDWNPALLCLAVWLQQAITNLSESHWFNVTSVDFVFLSATTFSLARLQLQRDFLAVHGPVPAAST